MIRDLSGWWFVVASLLVLAHACSTARFSGNEPRGPMLTFPTRFAEGESIDAGVGVAPSASASARSVEGYRRSAAERVSLQGPPDPEALQSARHWEYSISYDAGRVKVTGVAERRFRRPVVTPRHLGRFAIELWIGRELVDRVRFDFPGLAAEPVPQNGPKPLRESPTLGKALVAGVKVLVPASPRATRAVLVDRATGAEQLLPWPPDVPLPPVTRASAADAAGAAPSADALDAAAEGAD